VAWWWRRKDEEVGAVMEMRDDGMREREG